jgi:hypothetical protein
MKLTKNIITREEALAICPQYVAFAEGSDNFDGFTAINDRLITAKKGERGITFYGGQYVRITVSSVVHDDPRAVDGPVVRVGNGEATWRCDGDKYAWLEPKGTEAARKAVDAVLAK